MRRHAWPDIRKLPTNWNKEYDYHGSLSTACKEQAGLSECIVCEMLAQHFAVLFDHMRDELFVFIHIRHGLGHVSIVARGRKKKRHMELGCLDSTIFTVRNIDEFVGQLEKSCRIQFALLAGGTAFLAVLRV